MEALSNLLHSRQVMHKGAEVRREIPLLQVRLLVMAILLVMMMTLIFQNLTFQSLETYISRFLVLEIKNPENHASSSAIVKVDL